MLLPECNQNYPFRRQSKQQKTHLNSRKNVQNRWLSKLSGDKCRSWYKVKNRTTSTMVLSIITKQDPHSPPRPHRQSQTKQKHWAGGTAQESVHGTSLSSIFWTQVKSWHGRVCAFAIPAPGQRRQGDYQARLSGLKGKPQISVREPVSR